MDVVAAIPLACISDEREVADVAREFRSSSVEERIIVPELKRPGVVDHLLLSVVNYGALLEDGGDRFTATMIQHDDLARDQ